MINIAKSKKAFKGQKRPAGKQLSSVVEMGDFFGVHAQKFRVVDMNKPFPRDKSDEIIPMTPDQVIVHCQGQSGCGMLMRMKFKANPDKPDYKDTKKKK